MTTRKPVAPRPPLRMKLSIASGNLIQAAGLAAGAALLALAAAMTGPGLVRLAAALAGFLAVYDCSHAVGHYLAGRAVGIRFRFYGIRGTDHPEDYPPGFRQLMSAVPFWTVVTDKDSMRAAAPWKKALMFASGENATALCSLAAAYAVMAGGVPGGRILFLGTVIWNAVSTVTVARTPKGDYAKALRALRSRPAPAPAAPRPADHSRRGLVSLPPPAPVIPASPPKETAMRASRHDIDLATRVQRRRDFTAHLTGFLSGVLVLGCLLLAGVSSTSLYAATLLTWATALSFQHFRHVLRGPVTAAAVQAEATRLTAPRSADR